MSKKTNDIIDADMENMTDSILGRAIKDAKKKKDNLPSEKILIGRKKKNKKTKANRKTKDCGCK